MWHTPTGEKHGQQTTRNVGRLDTSYGADLIERHGQEGQKCSM